MWSLWKPIVRAGATCSRHCAAFCIFVVLWICTWHLVRSSRTGLSVQQSFSFSFGGVSVLFFGLLFGVVGFFFAFEAGLTGHLVLEIFSALLKRHELLQCQSSDVCPEDSGVTETCRVEGLVILAGC